MELVNAGDDPLHIVDEPENGELLLHWLGASEERVVGTTGWESEEDEAFEDFVEFEEEWV